MCFFFKRKTAYELRISDWSSDVCSSDLIASLRLVARIHQFQPLQRSVFPPCLQFTGMKSVVCRAALAEQQPVAPVTGVDARFQQRPQSCQAGPVADQQQGAIVGWDGQGRACWWERVGKSVKNPVG